jgi:hypothetical protein
MDAVCKAGKHSASAENLDKRGRCKLCQREWFKERWRRLHPVERKSPSWDGTLEQFFKLRLIEIRGPHWLWRGRVNRRTLRPAFGKYGRHAGGLARVLWNATGREPIPEGNILVQNSELCPHMLCVNPGCYRVIPKATAISAQVRAARLKSVSSQSYLTLERRILKRITRDDTGCWRWLGAFTRVAANNKRAYFVFRNTTNRTINVRRYLYERTRGKIPPQHVLCHHADKQYTCSNPEECVAPGHMALLSRHQFGAEVCAVRRHAAAKRRTVGQQDWPGTLWEVGPLENCKHCQRPFEFHGAPEWVARKLGIPLNQQHRVCKPVMPAPIPRVAGTSARARK